MENLVTLTYDSTHYYLISGRSGKLLVDAGLPGSMPKFKAQLNQYNIRFFEITYVMMTHHHPDHAGILQEIKNASGAKLIIHEKQVPFLASLAAYYKKKGGYVPIQIGKDDLVITAQNRVILSSIGFQGEMVETPGHSEDSISLVLDSGMAFVGDLNPLYGMDPENEAVHVQSWKKLIDRNAQVFYPAHANPVSAAEIKQLLEIL
jgi:ribonuclease/clavin/mitogillin